jgi:hypothetical protein
MELGRLPGFLHPFIWSRLSGLMQFLTADQKQQHVNIFEKLLQIASDNATFLSEVITDDKSWIYGYEPETEQQSSPVETVMFYGNCIKMCEGFAPNYGNERTGCCITTTHHLMKIKLKGRHFDINKVVEAESQALLNTLRENDFQDAF